MSEPESDIPRSPLLRPVFNAISTRLSLDAIRKPYCPDNARRQAFMQYPSHSPISAIPFFLLPTIRLYSANADPECLFRRSCLLYQSPVDFPAPFHAIIATPNRWVVKILNSRSQQSREPKRSQVYLAGSRVIAFQICARLRSRLCFAGSLIT
jgi:hypothetical protein